MTSREEALKALEKAVELVAKATPGPWRWSENGNLMATGDRDVDEICAVYTERDDDAEPKNAAAIRAAVNFIREHGPSILATASEQAPVAYQYRRRGSGHEWGNCPWDSVADLRMGTEFEVRELFTSPAHTSEARDAARYQFLAGRAHQDKSYDIFGNGGHWSIGVHSNDNRLDFGQAVDAAMRQEAGDE